MEEATGVIREMNATEPQAPPLLRVQGLTVLFPERSIGILGTGEWFRAVDGVDLNVRAGRTLGLVGESGCGKSTLARSLVGLVTPSSGRIELEGRDVTRGRGVFRRAVRRHVQMVFQDPYGSLNPYRSIGATLAEPLVLHPALKENERGFSSGKRSVLDRARARHRRRTDRVVQLLDQVGLSSVFLNRFPHELSGGQRQRVGIARALAAQPKLIICDEPVTALDVSVQAQVLDLLVDLQRTWGIAYLLIAHDLSIVRHGSHEVAVMYQGRIVEHGERESIFQNARHPYTLSLLAASFVSVGYRRARWSMREGESADPMNVLDGCAFHPRCLHATDRCRQERPELRGAVGGGTTHFVACHYAEKDLAPPPEKVSPDA